jgi:WD40 repeat protein
VLSIAIDRLGKNVAVGSGGGIGLWSRTTNAYVWSHEWQNFPGVKDGAVWDIAFSGDERHVIANLFRPGLVGSNDPVELRLYRVNDGKLLWTQKSQQSRCTSLCFHSQEATVLTASMDGKIRLFNGTTGQLRAMLDPPNSKVRHACFAANGRAILASGEDGAVWQWSLRP